MDYKEILDSLEHSIKDCFLDDTKDPLTELDLSGIGQEVDYLGLVLEHLIVEAERDDEKNDADP